MWGVRIGTKTHFAIAEIAARFAICPTTTTPPTQNCTVNVKNVKKFVNRIQFSTATTTAATSDNKRSNPVDDDDTHSRGSERIATG